VIKQTAMNILGRVLKTETGWAVLPLRLALGVIFVMEGTGKLYGWFGGGGWVSTCTFFRDLGIPFPEVNAFLVGYTEFLGGLAFLGGFLVRPAALGIGITMVVAIITAHLDGGWHYPLTVLTSCIALLFLGAGNLSLDKRIGSSMTTIS